MVFDIQHLEENDIKDIVNDISESMSLDKAIIILSTIIDEASHKLDILKEDTYIE